MTTVTFLSENISTADINGISTAANMADTVTSDRGHGPASLYPPRYYIERAGCIPMSVLGIVGNVVSLAVWNTQRTYSTTIFLFKYLAVWDIVFLVTIIPVILLSDNKTVSVQFEMFDVSSYLAVLVSVHTTLLIAVSRWLAAYRPVHVHTGSLLSRRHVIIACLVIFLWCLVIAVIILLVKIVMMDSKTRIIVYITFSSMGMALPVLPLVVCNVLLLHKLHSPFSPESPTSYSVQQQQQPRTWDTKRLTLAIVLMSLFSLLAFTVGEITTNYYSLIALNEAAGHRGAGSVESHLSGILESSFYLLKQINSSINVLFYFVFSREFRKVCTKYVGRCLSRSRVKQVDLHQLHEECGSRSRMVGTTSL
ncbi:uncharacterized protein LOC112561394 [Pomacea canaliculata]|uniref:uncharacterized protein LOC112561394 n=1 Tax=Pomacea canaliculata TaxID=400727 RepID=UPI000D728129|nr:uncharacterized protein LOC112561394 [Pomacea canaliculata]